MWRIQLEWRRARRTRRRARCVLEVVEGVTVEERAVGEAREETAARAVGVDDEEPGEPHQRRCDGISMKAARGVAPIIWCSSWRRVPGSHQRRRSLRWTCSSSADKSSLRLVHGQGARSRRLLAQQCVVADVDLLLE